MKIWNTDWILDRQLASVILRPKCTTMIESTASENHRERRHLMASATIAVEYGRTTELGCYDNDGLIKKAALLQIFNQRRDGVSSS